ncbi:MULTISPECIES: Cof-type HAD-IIB family hydrolase [Pontibacillus]|uniref:Cof-type HAD-IIB family hydrolase n=1 Tax=Pontibacillus chungwhensis TaxID=265426 RepID=A0ABY8UWL3_9BACI|nr:Cof-type HAD-IIB family hydrolase [Pontibacillus chungwhensis]WIF98076.1 Cof-type HAD-IIB family hydrolase [Pontibacillus chungwhensis]
MEHKDIKLIALDMDGTLLTPDHEISEANKEAIHKAKEKGIHVVISTGRSLSNFKEIIEPLGESAYFVTINGGEIYDGAFNLVERNPLNGKDVRHLWDLTNKHNAYFWSSTVQGRFNSQEPFDNEVEDYEWLKYGFEFEDPELRETILSELENNDSFEITNSSPTNIEINPAGINKATALRKVTSWLDLTMDQVMAVGDSVNDLAMIREAGYGVAMGNAQDIVKEEATWVTASNKEDGVAKAINAILDK